jgi:hypothetical protein
MANLRCIAPTCGKPITRMEKRLNAGLCSKCLDKELREVAKRLGKK